MALHKISSVIQFSERALPSGDPDSAGEGKWSPNTDVYLCGEGVVITLELSGMRREDLELVIEGQKLRIRGHRGDESRPGSCSFLAMEISFGAFEKAIELPPGYDLSLAKAVYQNGFLRVEVPRKPDSEGPRSMAIQGETP